MSDWILYDEFVDLVRNHHHDGFSGLITGVSDTRHSFQIGFDRGEIVLLTYRIKKGLSALQYMTQIERAKISEHPNRDIHDITREIIDTSSVLSQLTASTLDETSTTTTDINDLPETPAATIHSSKLTVDAKTRRKIESAAIHHFGPIGAMVCEEHLTDPRGDLRTIIIGIAQEVGASEADTRAFYQDLSGS